MMQKKKKRTKTNEDYLLFYVLQVHNYWDQWPLVDNGYNYEEDFKLYSIPDTDHPPSPPRPITFSPQKPTSISIERNNLNNFTRSLSTSRTNQSQTKVKVKKQKKKKKKPMSEYRPPSPFSPKPDYKSMDVEQLKTHAMRYGLSTNQAKGKLMKILDEIYRVTHQYETDTDYEYESDMQNDTNLLNYSKRNFNLKYLLGCQCTGPKNKTTIN